MRIANGVAALALLSLAPALADGAQGRMDFFLCDHDHVDRFPDQLRAFLSSHTILFLDSAPQDGREHGLVEQRRLQDISNGSTPLDALYSREWLKVNTDPSVGLMIAVASGIRGTRKRVYLEAASWPEDLSREISRLWQMRRSDSGAARGAEQRRMTIRDEAMLEKLLMLRNEYPDQAIGAIVGSFHTWPYLQAKARLESPRGDYHVGYEFAPPSNGPPRPHTHVRSDPGYRVIETPGSAFHEQTIFPLSGEKWELRYEFVVPPIPAAGSWDFKRQVFYLWGDVDFDQYGSRGVFPLSRYHINQIVPQLMIGHALSSNATDYAAHWDRFDHWVIEAQYFWYADRQTPLALAGEPVSVSPGDVVTTIIRYDPRSGTIFAGISTPSAESTITIPRPFPNEGLFKTWRDFFEQAERRSGHVLGQAVINVESHEVAEDALCTILPFQIRAMAGPGFPANGADSKTRTEGRFRCPTPLVKLGF